MLTHTKFQDVGKKTGRCVQRRTSDLGQTCLQGQVTELNEKTPSKNSTRNKE